MTPLGVGVRIKVIFGQGCVRCGVASDMAGLKKQGRVRSRVNFGQGWTKKARSCPKSGELRTWQDQKSKVVSEVVRTSDTAELKKQGRVRSRANFGQGRAKKARSCPKSSELRTWQDQKSKVVSEVGRTSDMAGQKSKVVSEVA